MKLTALGTNGWMPTNNQKTSSFLIEHKGYLIILDCGNGISNLYKYEDILKNYKHVHIILTHYHLDHIIGIMYLNNFFKDYNVHIYGPGKPYYSSMAEKLSALTDEDFFYKSALNTGRILTLTEYSLEGFEIGHIKVNVNLQEHSNYSFGITIDDALHYAVDTSVVEANFEIGQNVKFFLHECCNMEKEKSGHSSLKDILTMKENYKLDNLYLVHKNPTWTEDNLSFIKSKLPVLMDGDSLE